MTKKLGYLILVTALLLGSALIAFPQTVTQLAGLAVAQTSSKWNKVKDMAAGDGLTNGSAMFTPCLYNGTTCDRQRGTIAGGALVAVTSLPTSGTGFFEVQRSNITTSSVNLAFGFTSKKIMVRAAGANTADICIDWIGGTAVCPAANTAGDGRLAPGTDVLLDDYAQTSLSVIADTGTQQVNITAWN